MKQNILKDLINLWFDFLLKTQTFAKVNDVTSPAKYPIKEAIKIFLRIKYKELKTIKFIPVAINPDRMNLNI